jgi:site-specific recombinase XerD
VMRTAGPGEHGDRVRALVVILWRSGLRINEALTLAGALRHAHAVEMAREGIPLPVIQRQLGHAHLGVTSTYLQGIDTTEIINTIHASTAPVIPASAGLRL